MNFYSINGNHIMKEHLNIENKNTFVEFGPIAQAASQSIKIMNPPKKYDYSKWVKKTNKNDLQYLLAYPSVSIFPNRSKYTDSATTYVEFNLLVTKSGTFNFFLDANGYDDKSNLCQISINIPSSELFFGNDISKYLIPVELPNDENDKLSYFTLDLEEGINKIRIHIKEDGFKFRSINLISNFENATFISRNETDEKLKSDINPGPIFSEFSKKLHDVENDKIELEIDEDKSNDEIMSDTLNEINMKLDNLISQSKIKSEDSKKVRKKVKAEVEEQEMSKLESDSEDIIYKVEMNDINKIFDFNEDSNEDKYDVSNLILLIFLLIFLLMLIIFCFKTNELSDSIIPTPTPLLIDSSSEFL